MAALEPSRRIAARGCARTALTEGSHHDGLYAVWRERQHPSVGDIEWRLRNLLWRQRVLLRRHDVRGRRVLDYGCMDGVFTIALQRAGADAVGYDVSEAAIAQAKAFRGDAKSPVFTTEPPERRAFDLVFCAQVLEHVDDDRAFIGELVSHVAPGGRVVGTTPVGRHFWDPDHKRFYDERSLRATLEPWGRAKVRRYYRSPIRNLLPVRQRGAAVFIFEVEPGRGG